VKSLSGSAMITLKEALSDAQRRRIAIGHFNVSDLVGLKAVTGAAQVLNVPVLVGTSEGERNFLGVHEIVALVTSLRQQHEHPIFLNADHTHSLERVVEAAQAGYDMIAFDASSVALEKNIGLTKQAVEAAKSINPRIIVEGELGFIGSGSEIHESVPESSRLLTTTDDAQCFVEATKIDVLAPAVGNMHGLLKSMVTGEVRKRLAIDRIREIATVTALPLTLHGGSGTDDGGWHCDRSYQHRASARLAPWSRGGAGREF
jgi:fructose-bisphosphate aldolase, class II